jgi:hypothetical protein
MACTMEMLTVIKGSKPPGKVPDGLKVSFGADSGNKPVPAGPVLAVGSFILWPMSYYDNRVSFCMVMFDPKGKVINMVEKKGVRYVYKVAMAGSGGSGSVTFVGQADQSVTMSIDEICGML